MMSHNGMNSINKKYLHFINCRIFLKFYITNIDKCVHNLILWLAIVGTGSQLQCENVAPEIK